MDSTKTDLEELHNQLEAIKAEYMAKIDQSDYDSKLSITSRIEAYKAWVTQLGIIVREEEKTEGLEGIIKLNKNALNLISTAILKKDVPLNQRNHYLISGIYSIFSQSATAHVRPNNDNNILISVKSHVYLSVLIILFALSTVVFFTKSFIWLCLLILNLGIIISKLVMDASGHELTHIVQFNVLRDIKKRLNLPSAMAYIMELWGKIDLEISLGNVHKNPPDKQKLKLIIKNIFDQVERYLGRKISSINPEDAEFYYGRALAYAKQDNFTQAICDYTKAIEIKPNNALAYSNRGYAYYEQGNFTQSISDYTKAIEMNPKNVELYYSIRGIAYEKQGNFTQSILDFTKAIELNSKFAVAYNSRGHAYFKDKNFDKAWADVHKAESLGYKSKKADLEFLEDLKKASGRDR